MSGIFNIIQEVAYKVQRGNITWKYPLMTIFSTRVNIRRIHLTQYHESFLGTGRKKQQVKEGKKNMQPRNKPCPKELNNLVNGKGGSW